MKLKILNTLVVTAGLLVPMAVSQAQSPYNQAVTGLSPVGYWPMHENEPTVAADIETNYGTLGTLETGFYGDWETLANTKIVHGQPGCIVNDSSETAVHFTQTSTSASTGSFTNGLIVPHTSPLSTLNPPFSVECWMNGDASGNKQADIWSQAGANNGGLNGNANLSGIRLHWDNVGWNVYCYNGANGSTLNTLFTYNTGIAAGVWYHTVVTDDGTNITLWINGVAVKSAPQAGNYAPDSWDPLTLDAGVGGGIAFNDSMKGYIDEFAVYTNALSPADVTNHYSLGENSTANAYFSAVISNNPTIYFLMNSPGITNDLPVAMLSNSGSSGINGVYRPEVLPGGVSGPGALGAGFGASNAMPGNGCDGFADVGNSAAYNPTGASTNFSVVAWFKGNPTDSRNQSIVGHGTNSWQLGLTSKGLVVFNSGTNSAAAVATGTGAGDLVSPGVFNDGFWHFAAATHGVSTNTLYVDGVPVATNTSLVSIPGSSSDVLIGADPSFTNTPIGEGRQFAGDACEVAYFATNLAAAQIQTLYNDSEMSPVITQQPVSATVGANSAFTNNVTAIGVGTLSYQWYLNNALIGGATSSSLVINPVEQANAGNYYVVAQNTYGSTTSAVVTLTVQAAAIITAEFPLTLTNLLNTNYMTLYAGAGPTFSISAVGAQPLSYFWFTNGVVDGGATNAAFTLTNVQIGAFNTWCIVSNPVNTATSAVWTASVIAGPTNSGGGLASYPQAVLSMKPIAYWRLNEADNGTGNEGVIAHDYAGGNNGLYTNVILGQVDYNPVSDPSDTSVEVGTGSYTTFSYISSIGTNIDFSAPAGSNAEYTVECWAKVSANGGGIIEKGYNNGGEECILDTAGSHDAFRYLIRPASQSVQYQVTDATVPNGSLWYHLAAVCDEAHGQLSLYVNGALDFQTNIPTGQGLVADVPASLTIGAEASSAGSGPVVQSAGSINDVAVFNYALTAAQIAFQYNQSGIPPYFTQQPAAISYVGQGSNAVITAAANGTSPLGYQWYETNLTALTGFAVPGQTNATLVISNFNSSDNYFLNVTNPYGSTNSIMAQVIAYSSPVIIGSLPVTYTNVGNVSFMKLYTGANPNFSVSALGFGTLSYQWFTNGAPIIGATGTNLSLVAAAVGTLTTACIVSNSLGTATNIWIASVLANPTNSTGGPAYFPQTVLALHPAGYWRLNESPDDGNGDFGLICHDYAGGDNGLYTNGYIAQPGYNPTEDPSDTSCYFGAFANPESLVGGVQNVDFSQPHGVNAEMTVEAWVYPTFTPTANTPCIVAKGYYFQEQFDLDCAGPGKAFRFECRPVNGTEVDANSTVGLTNNAALNQWYHLAGVCDEANGHTYLYVNGALAGSSAIPVGGGLTNSLGTPMRIGSRSQIPTGADSEQFLGYINDVAVFPYALTPGQVAAEYAAVSPTAPIFTTTPPTNSGAVVNSSFVISAAAGGTPPLAYVWTNVTAGTTLATGSVANAAVVSAPLSIRACFQNQKSFV